MRQRNMRIVYTGIGLIVLAIVFFAVMMGMAPKSNDPATMMQTVGEAAGVVIGIGVVMAVFGLIGRKN